MTEPRIEGYALVRPLGQGAVSAIHLARDERLGRRVVLKTLRANVQPSSPLAGQIRHEGEILADLSHAGVVLLFDRGEDADGRPYLVLEHVDGFALRDVLAKKRPVAPTSALAIACGMLAALDHVHGRGVVHRDVKPGNVLLSRTGEVKLCDFGIALEATHPDDDPSGFERISSTGKVEPRASSEGFGTPWYMSPEQLLGDYVDERSDLYSVGVVLYQMLTGTRPFADDRPRPAAGAPARRREVPPLRERAPDVPRAIERLVLRLLETRPLDRAASAGEALATAEETLHGLTRDSHARLVRRALVDCALLVEPRASVGTGAALDARGPLLGTLQTWGALGAVALAFSGAAFASEGGLPKVTRRTGEPGDALETAPPVQGALRVLATPWAEVWVDGALVDVTPFARPIPLAPGAHHVRFVHPTTRPEERTITIEAGRTASLDVVLDVDTGLDAGAAQPAIQGKPPTP